jgi:hypothetical protein
MKTETEILIEISGLEQQISEIKKSEFNLRRLNTQRIIQAKIDILKWVIND